MDTPEEFYRKQLEKEGQSPEAIDYDVKSIGGQRTIRLLDAYFFHFGSLLMQKVIFEERKPTEVNLEPRGVKDKCTCACHRVPGIKHMVACCDKTYQQF